MRTRIGWLDSRHTFTFEEHIHPRHMGFRALRVLNEDRIAPGRGYGSHSRRELELVTYVVAGSLRHQDSLGTDVVLASAALQRITAGTGILHTETNASTSEPLHLVQMWIAPERTRLRPSYKQRTFALKTRRRALTLLASHEGRDGSVRISQDVAIFSCALEAGGRASLALADERHVWAQVVSGNVHLNGVALTTGDGASVSEEVTLEVASASVSETLLFDLA
jgi:quercetin 2,3-dioxygenase